jgi:hypothetical protein
MKIIIGIALYVAGLTLLIIAPHPLYYQAPINVLLPSLATIFVCATMTVFGVFILGIGLRADLQKDSKLFLIGTIVAGAWMFLVMLPIMLLPLPEEASVLAVSFSLLLLVLMVICCKKWSEKRKEKSKKKVERKAKEV